MFATGSHEGKCTEIHAGWYAVYTRHQHEKRVYLSLSEKGLETFLPLYTADRPWKDRIKRLELPLFPCYLFLRASLQRQYDVLSTPGVYNLVGTTGRPEIIPTAEIDSLRRIIQRRIQAVPHPFLKCGDHVRIKSGPLQGVQGILVRRAGQTKIVISVELLQRAVAVEVAAADVEKASIFSAQPPSAPYPVNVHPCAAASEVVTTACS